MAIRSRGHSQNEAGARFRAGAVGRSCAAAAFLLILCFRVAAANAAPAQAGSSELRSVTDETGRRVQVPQMASRIVSLAPNLTEIVYALGDGNRLAGDTDYCDYPPEASAKPHVGSLLTPNFERIVALMPDVILATAINRRETVSALDRLGLPVFVTDPHTVEEMVASVEHLGVALGVEKSAAHLVNQLRERLSELDRRMAGVAPRRVLFVVWIDPLTSVGRDTYVADALRRAGGVSVVDTKSEWPHVSMEEVVRLQPDFLVFTSGHESDMQGVVDALRTQPGWKSLNAIRKGNVVVTSDAINRPAPRMIDAIERLARALHPDAFASREFTIPDSILTAKELCACAR